ncbi:MAG: peptidoglycan synthetase [Arcobacteraceae bacterium]|nr:peptidoglycan synthetase [Arcobacteraceae bacterium]
MKISSIVDITDGKLQNNPAISFITQSHTNISKVNDGDLFISSSLKQIKQALEQGAFAIIYDFEIDYKSLDNEIAWIKVKNIENSLTKLLRYNLSNKKLDCYSLDLVSYEILFSLQSTKKDIIFLTSDNFKNFELLKDLKEIDTIVSTDKVFIKKIYPLSKELNIEKYSIKNLIIHSLFETSFSYKDKYFHKLKLPQIYINNFISIINFLNKTEYDISKLNNFKHMQPIFINKNNEIVDYGKSNRFILSNTNNILIKQELEFISNHYKYGKIKVIEGLCFDEILLDDIKPNDYNALYIKNRTNIEIIDILKQNMDDNIKLF